MSDQKQRVYWERDHRFRPYDHPVVRFFALQRIDYIRTWLHLEDVKTALDVGCGDGLSTYYMHKYVPNIWGVDRSSRVLARHPLRSTGKVCVGDASELAFADKTFDLVYGWEVLHHISDPGLVVAEMARVSRKYVLVAEPSGNHPAWFALALLDRDNRWVLRNTLPYLQSLFAGAGLEVEHSSRGGWVFPNVTPLWLIPLLQRIPYRFSLGISNWVLGTKGSSVFVG